MRKGGMKTVRGRFGTRDTRLLVGKVDAVTSTLRDWVIVCSSYPIRLAG
jgi:hypothetical protein